MKIRTALATAGATAALLLGSALPANAYVGELYDCRTKITYGWASKTTTTTCKKQLSSIKGILWTNVTWSSTKPYFGTNW